MFTSCQKEVVEVTNPNEAEALVANSELTTLISSTSKMDGSKDNIIDRASCMSVELPVTVIANGLEITIDSEEDYQVIKAIFDEFEDDQDSLQIIFPITIVLADHTEIVVENRDALQNLAAECQGENQPDDDIECIDFQYPISFSVYNTDFQVINNVTIENDRQLFRFIHRVKQGEVFASLDFPVTMELADGSTVVVHNNLELQNTINDAKDSCNEDDNNNFHDHDFTLDRLNSLLVTCPWVVHDFDRNAVNLTDQYREFVMSFKEDGVVKVRARSGDVLTGKWTTRLTDNGALIKLEFDSLVDFSLEWYVYDIEHGRIKLWAEGGNKIILAKNCDIVFDQTKTRIENYLKECFWRVERLNILGTDKESDYIGTPLKFENDGVVKLRVKGQLVTGTWEVLEANIGFVLQIHIDGRPDLQLEWLVTFLEADLIKLVNINNAMVLKRFCPDGDNDINYINDVMISSNWQVALYTEGDVDKTDNYFMYSINFLESGAVAVTDPNNGLIDGSWLAYRNEGLFLGLNFGIEPPFQVINHRWKITSISQTRIELKDFSSTGTVERVLVLEVK
ncbi:hypothetical protein GCM10007962_29570 [Yeosuana aromativorans]|uniref:Uncharacterized protein n=2 Tax=Yeosuana aromativorans TaxID=288019 RepID=A0A8J3BRL5_9FLAO|nr:hypothetical protein GCM10007962_29570 [Yeosuana aromativorans]